MRYRCLAFPRTWDYFSNVEFSTPHFIQSPCLEIIMPDLVQWEDLHTVILFYSKKAQSNWKWWGRKETYFKVERLSWILEMEDWNLAASSRLSPSGSHLPFILFLQYLEVDSLLLAALESRDHTEKWDYLAGSGHLLGWYPWGRSLGLC